MNQRTKNVIVAAGVFCLMCVTVCMGGDVRIVPDQFATIQDAIDAAQAGDTVLIRDGEYTGPGNYDIQFQGKPITVRSEHGPADCIIDCDALGRGFVFSAGETADSRLTGVTITGALTPGLDSGGGILCNFASPQIDNCIIKNCVANENGGGLCLLFSMAEVTYCEFINNEADGFGGAININGSSPMLYNCEITNNSSETGGGGIHMDAAQSPIIWNCLIADNYSGGPGGGIMMEMTDPGITHCTIFHNIAAEPGGGIAIGGQCSPTVLNSILWDNIPNSFFTAAGATPSVTYCDVDGGYAGTGNIDADPLFVSAGDGAFYLSHTDAGQTDDSPCIDAGSDDASVMCVDMIEGTVCMNELTTRTDGITDSDVADMGFHDTKRVCAATGVRLEMPGHTFAEGDAFWLKTYVCNTAGESLEGYALFVAMDIFGDLWFAPDWRPPHRGLCFYDVSYPPGLTEISVIPEVILPGFAETLSGLHFWSILSDPEMTLLLGDMDVWTFDLLASGNTEWIETTNSH